jgi:predicted DCC family thiol-disulfide oxidoreductase YuxK
LTAATKAGAFWSFLGRFEVALMVDEAALIIYDGDCIFCQNYARLVRLRDTVGKVEMLDARSSDPRVERYWRKGYDLNEGMLFVYQGKVYHGSDAVFVLAGLSSSTSWFNRLNRAIFSRRAAATTLYPLLKLGRRVTLLARGKGLISEPSLEN